MLVGDASAEYDISPALSPYSRRHGFLTEGVGLPSVANLAQRGDLDRAAGFFLFLDPRRRNEGKEWMKRWHCGWREHNPIPGPKAHPAAADRTGLLRPGAFMNGSLCTSSGESALLSIREHWATWLVRRDGGGATRGDTGRIRCFHRTMATSRQLGRDPRLCELEAPPRKRA